MGAAGAAVLLGAAAPAPQALTTRLMPVARDILTRATVAGDGRADASLAGSTLTVSGRYEGLPSAAVAAELRQGVAMGARGPVIAKLTVSGGQAGTLSGTVKLKRDQLAAAKAGQLYVQINSEKAPDGHLWGWLTTPRAPAAQ